jgi:hypothetical protein
MKKVQKLKMKMCPFKAFLLRLWDFAKAAKNSV